MKIKFSPIAALIALFLIALLASCNPLKQARKAHLKCPAYRYDKYLKPKSERKGLLNLRGVK
ncbi:hypothetical protein CLV24_11444 [Pontibacter ummariensis]|uniref:Lipoprotein n=1 Tax=Pontibacter ummariensis TaxID=1610492 RepID=A0A239HLQ5_9BACT|nr:hypothetical protein [Pontibacter ummariensis]PRY10316.1 hypothetical protein CLV24_11444 [Pontibacter ummariensis]SNS82085.1 hypothetical protein SAMN06296052_11444 [Pontibacter ummariensis]